MHVHVFDTADEAARAAAHRIAEALRTRPRLVLALPTGRTAVPVYAELRRLHAAGHADFSDTVTFNLDEFVGIPGRHAGSFRAYMEHHLFAHVNLDPRHVHVLDGMAPDPDAECARYEEAIAGAGGIDLQVLGIGANGHIGFNEPGEALVARTHRVVLHDTTRRANAGLFGGDPARVPREALSMGMGTIMQAASIVLVAMGEAKARCVEQTIDGPLTTRLPASFLQIHRRVELYLDRGAASRLPAKGR